MEVVMRLTFITSYRIHKINNLDCSNR